MIDKTIAQYHITEKIGEGGMGVVYKAKDTKLDRVVALKFLPEQFSASPDDKARFTQEAKAASALNHPNVCTIHDIQEFDGQLFMVMEYVDGQTLREKMGSLSYKQAIEIGIQLADGLAAAHEKGIIHRDIKPENIMVRRDGIAQIMDFGLAKLRGTVSRLTKQGSTIGTAGYMSPEQVQGQDADHRSDIFSFGVVLYEMLTGQPPFKGIHETALAYEIVNVDAAPMSAVKPSIDPMLDAIILECLEKDPNERTQSAKQVSIDLKRFRRESSKAHVSRITAAKPVMPVSATQQPQQAPETPVKQSRLPWFVAGVLAVAVVALAAMFVMRPKEEVRTVRAFLTSPPNISFAQQSSGLTAGGHIAVSPDGRRVAFVGADSAGKTQLYVRSLSSMIPLPLPGTEGAFYPFWSPNSRFIAFFTQGKLKKVDASGGPPLTVCDVREARGGSWGSSDVIIFTPGFSDPLFQVPAAGGVPTQLTTLDSSRQEATHRFPWFLPDGKHFLYFVRIGNGTDNDNVRIGSIDGTMNKELLKAHSNAVYANGYVLFVRDQTLVAQPFDAGSLTLTGNAVPIAEQLRFSLNYNQGSFSVSQQGELVFEGGLGPAVNQLAYFDRSGTNLTIIKETESVFEGAFSPDAKRIAYSTTDPQSRNEDIWVYNITRNVTTRLTFDPNDDTDPVWSPDGEKIAFSTTRIRPAAVFLKNADGTGNETQLFTHPEGLYPTSWSMDGKFITCTTYANRDILMYHATGDTTPITFVKTQFPEDEARFSPDGKWVSYTSTESGRREIYVRPFPGPGGKWQISTDGSRFRSFWRGDGKEIYYLSREGNIMAAEVGTNGGTFFVGAVKPLFDAQSKGGGDLLSVSPDGQKFLFVYNPVESKADRLTLVINWPEDVGKTE
jgi:serine/threonine protein kinase/Tol biopolymer transport system component